MKRNLVIFMLILMLAITVLVSCAQPETSSDGETSSSEPLGTSNTETSTTPAVTSTQTTTESGPSEEELRAMEMVEKLYSLYAVEGGNRDRAFVNYKEYHNTTQSGFLWTNFSAVGMQYYVCKLYPDDAEQKAIFEKMINNFKYFRQSRPDQNAAANSVKYHSGRGTTFYTGNGTCYFDDNIWVARNYLRAYEILGDKWYLEEAIRVNNWVLSGWNNELGGIVWSEEGLGENANEQHLERGLSANACGIIVNAMLAGIVEDEAQKAFHLEWAEKFYNFCKKMQNKPITYDYFNGIHTKIVNGVRMDGDINKAHYAYNSGSMILANLALYKVTTDEAKKAEYLDDAIGTANAAKRKFNTTDPETTKRYYKHDPWFAAILCEAYFELGEFDRKLADSLMKTFANNAKYAFENRDKATGLLPYQATRQYGSIGRNDEHWGIHQIGTVQQAVMAALYDKTYTD